MSAQTQPTTEASAPAEARAESTAGFLANLHDELQAVRQRLDSSERQLFAYLHQRPDAPVAGDAPELSTELKGQVAALTKQLANFAAQRLKEFQTVAQEELTALRAAVREDLQAARQAAPEEPLILPDTAILPAIKPPGSGSGGAAPSAEGWLSAVFGGLLASNEELAGELQQILDAAGAGHDAARQLVGSLLLLQSSGVDRAPNLLKDVGEAFYRWRPKTIDDYDPLERGLLAAVQQRCETLGLPNVVELVRPGDRFDSVRHTSRERGLEVAEVQGWVVLRDQGKVISRALVVLR